MFKDQLKNKHKNQTCYVIGKGPSLNYLKKEHITPSYPIICLNESIILIESLELQNTNIYSLQQNNDPQCWRKPKKAMLITDQLIESEIFIEYKNRCVINREEDLGLKRQTYSALAAIELARFFGCVSIIFIGFDACYSQELGYTDRFDAYYLPANLKHFTRHAAEIPLQLVDIKAKHFIPKENKYLQVKECQDFAVLTPTGDRQKLFNQCQKYLLRQTILPKQWLVIDDGYKKLNKLSANIDYYARERTEEGHTLRFNILHALDKIKYDKVIIMEDDDWYHPEYLEFMLNGLQDTDLFGYGCGIYYHVKLHCYVIFKNHHNAAFCATGFTSQVFDKLKEVCFNPETNWSVDIQIWRKYINKKQIIPTDKNNIYVLGMKGLPSRRPGLTHSHKETGHPWTQDPDYEFLYKTIGDDIDFYQKLIGEQDATIKDRNFLNKKPVPLSMIRAENETRSSKNANYSMITLPTTFKNTRLRTLDNGCVALIRSNRLVEAFLDEQMERVGPHELVWRHRVEDITELKEIYSDFENRHCYIVGKGPSLDLLEAKHFEHNGPVICINESIHKVEELGVPNRIFCMQQDIGLRNTCKPKYGSMIITASTRQWYSFYGHVYIYYRGDYGLGGGGIPTGVIAIKILHAAKASKITMLCFDACVTEDVGYANCIGYQPTRGGNPKRFLNHKDRLLQSGPASLLRWIIPKSPEDIVVDTLQPSQRNPAKHHA